MTFRPKSARTATASIGRSAVGAALRSAACFARRAAGAALLLIAVLPISARAQEDVELIAGLVVDPTGAPQTGATVSLWLREAAADPVLERDFARAPWPERPEGRTTTGADGRFEFRAVRRAPLRWVSAEVEGRATGAADATQATAALRVVLAPGTARTLRFLSPGGIEPTPPREARLLVFPSGGPSFPGTIRKLDADGRVTVTAGPADLALLEGPGLASHIEDFRQKEDVRWAPLGGPVEGVVVDRAGRPVAGARVTVAGQFRPSELRATTDAEGRFRFEALPCGSKSSALVVEAQGCSPAAAPVHGGDRWMRVVVAPPSELRGVVVDESDRPVAGAVVSGLRALETWDPLGASQALVEASAETDAQGAFRIAAVGAGVWSIDARRDGGPVMYRGGRSIVVEVGRTPEPVSVTVRQVPCPMTVHVRDETGKSVTGVDVRADRWTAAVSTGKDGTAIIGVRGARRTVDDWPELTLEGPALRGRAVVVPASSVPSPAARVDIDLVTEPAMLRIRVLDAARRHVDDPYVRVLSADEGTALACSPRPFQSAAKRPIAVPGRLPFRLQVWRDASDSSRAEHDAVHRADEAVRGELTIVLPSRSTLRARLDPPAPDGLGLRLQAVLVSDAPEVPAVARTELSARLAGGELVVNDVTAGPWRLVVRRAFLPNGCLALRQISATGGALDLGDLRPYAVVQGTVRSSAGPVAGASVGLLEAGFDRGPPLVQTFTDANGAYTLRVPHRLEGVLFAGRAGYGIVGRPMQPKAATEDFELPPAGTLILRKAIDAFRVAYPVTVRSGGAWVTTVASENVGGDVVLWDVAPGSVDISFPCGRETRHVTAVVKEGVVTEVDLGASFR